MQLEARNPIRQHVRKLLVPWACALTVIVAGCTSATNTPNDFDESAKSFEPAAGKANIYVVRPEIVGADVTHTILLDGSLVGQLATNSFFLLAVNPGVHVLSISDNEGEYSDMVQLVAKEGLNYFLEVISAVGYPPVTIATVDDDRGREIVMGARRAFTMGQW